MTPRELGTVKMFRPQLGFGWIIRDRDPRRHNGLVFVYLTAIALRKGERVSFVLRQASSGPWADQVERLTQ